jgi:hypothetical protein
MLAGLAFTSILLLLALAFIVTGPTCGGFNGVNQKSNHLVLMLVQSTMSTQHHENNR